MFAQTPMEASVQAVGPMTGDHSTAGVLRIPVLVSSEAPARLLLDALDARKITVGTVASLWQVMAAAWDPSAASAAGTDDAPSSAQILVDPAGRVLWSWSIRGVLLAAGAVRTHAADRGDILTAELAPRLAAEWLAWSAQVGVSPQRVACIALEGDQSAAGFGAALAKVWPGASVDMTFSADPLGLTLQRVAQVMEDRTQALVSIESLATRPGRQHRSMFVWAAVAFAAVAAAIGGLAVSFNRDAGRARRDTEEIRNQWQGLVKDAMPAALTSPYGERDALRGEIEKRERELRPPDKAEPTYPVMEVLEIISLVLSTSEIKLEDITVDTGLTRVSLAVTVSSTEEFEPLTAALKAIENPYISSWDMTYTKQSDTKISVRYSGVWSDFVRTGRPAGGGSGK
jgi:hypothetical protein